MNSFASALDAIKLSAKYGLGYSQTRATQAVSEHPPATVHHITQQIVKRPAGIPKNTVTHWSGGGPDVLGAPLPPPSECIAIRRSIKAPGEGRSPPWLPGRMCSGALLVAPPSSPPPFSPGPSCWCPLLLRRAAAALPSVDDGGREEEPGRAATPLVLGLDGSGAEVCEARDPGAPRTGSPGLAR